MALHEEQLVDLLGNNEDIGLGNLLLEGACWMCITLSLILR